MLIANRSLRVIAAGCALLGWLVPAASAHAQQTLADSLRASYSDAALDRVYTLEELRKLPAIDIATTTPWTEGVQRFRGVALSTLLHLRPDDRILHMRAINDYFVTMPAGDLHEHFPIVAYERNGAPMSVRDKGRFWLVYPFDQNPRFSDETHLSRSIWQLVEIRVLR